MVNKYRCVACGKEMERDSTKTWIKSYCADTDQFVNIWLIDGDEDE
jgi:phage FluMu protein Com